MCSGRGTRGKRTTSPRGKSGMTGGSSEEALLAADDLHGQVAVARAVELGRDDGLELAQHQLALAHGEGTGVAEERGLEVRVRVQAVAVRDLGVVVLPDLLRAD